MRPVTPDELRLHLHELMDLFCNAPASERANILARLRRRERLYFYLQEYLEEMDGLVEPEQVPPLEIPQPTPAGEGAKVIEGPFIRLLQGGKLLHTSGEHRMSEGEVVDARLQNGDIVRAVPCRTGDTKPFPYSYEVRRPGPLVDPEAVQDIGYPESLDQDLALVRTQQGEVLVALRDMQGLGATLDHVLTVAFVRATVHGGRHLGRVVKVHATPEEPCRTYPKPEHIRKKREPELGGSEPMPVSAPLPRFQPSGGKQPIIVLVGGHPQNRARYESMLAEYGAVLRGIPYSPKVRQVRMAVDASDIVIGFPSCCRTAQWKTALDTARSHERIFFYGESENESGLRHLIETEIIPHWNSLSTNADSA